MAAKTTTSKKTNGSTSKPTLKTIEKAAKRTDDRLNTTIDGSQNELKKAIANLQERIKKLVNDLKTGPQGKLLGPKVNLKQAQQIHKSLNKIYEDTYGEAVKSTVKDWNKISGWVEENYSDLGVATKFTDIDHVMIKQLKDSQVFNLLEVGKQSQATISNALYQHVAAQAPFDTLVTTIAASLVGQKDARGKPLSQYAELYANDGVMNFYNSVHIEKGRQAGLKHFMYMGTIIETTREFCQQRVKRVYTEEEINSWDYAWAGKSGPAMTARGGYNCRHHWQPVDLEWFDKGEIDRSFREAETGLYWEQLDKSQKTAIGNLGSKYIPKGKIMGENTVGMQTWNAMSVEAQQMKISQWTKKGYTIPDELPVKGGVAKIPKKPPATKIPKKPPKPEATIAFSEAIVAEETGGLLWNQLDKAQKTSIGNLGSKYIPKGKMMKPGTIGYDTWVSLSYETQQMKISQWVSKGYKIPAEMPLKGAGSSAQNIAKQAGFGVPKGPMNANNLTWDYSKKGKIQQAFKKAFNFNDVSYGTMTEAKGSQILNSIGKHLDEVKVSHPKLEGYLKKVKGASFEIVQGQSVGGGAAGVYSDQTKILKVASDLSKKHGLNVGKGGFSVGSDFYSVGRHEFGHHVDKVLRTLHNQGKIAWNHQDEWRTIYKSFNKAEWTKLMGKYSSVDKYEGFAEAFSAYTSPKYKPGMLPDNVEKYMHKVLGGKRKVVTPSGRPPFSSFNVPGRIFKNPAHEEAYQNFYNYYMRKLKGKDYLVWKKTLMAETKSKCPNVLKAMRRWQSSTQSSHPSALKYMAEILEKEDNIKFFAAKGRSISKASITEYLKTMPEEEYIRVRAMTQAFYDGRNIKKVRLFRGTDGQTSGPKFNKAVNEAKSNVPKSDWGRATVEIKEPALNGWSTKQSIANNFKGRGIVVETEIPTKDILIPDDFWPKTNYKSETEFIVLRRTNQAYKLEEIRSNFGRYGSGVAAEKKVEKKTEWLQSVVSNKIKEWFPKGTVLKNTTDYHKSIFMYIMDTPYYTSSKAVYHKLAEKLAAIDKYGADSIIFGSKIKNPENFKNALSHVMENIEGKSASELKDMYKTTAKKLKVGYLFT